MLKTGIALYATIAQALEALNYQTELAQMSSDTQLKDLNHILAQQTQAQCSKAQDRVKDGDDDFYDHVISDSKYTDNSFLTTASEALYYTWDSSRYQDLRFDSVYWRRLSEQDSSKMLFGPSGANYKDIQQGAIGDCWFMASM